MHKKTLLIFSLTLLFTSCSRSALSTSNNTQSDVKSNESSVESNELNTLSNLETSNSDSLVSESSSFTTSETTSLYDANEDNKALQNKGYVENKIIDFKQYENTSSYVQVDNAQDFLNALENAKYKYTSTFNEETNELEQTLEEDGKIHVIEITSDLDLGYYTLMNQGVSSSILTDFTSKINNIRPYFNMSEMFDTYGMSQIKVENTSNLLVFSKSGNKLTHCGFKLTSDTNVVFQNLSFDELWQWEDTSSSTVSKVGDYDALSWAYFKISFCEYILIDHCEFGKSYDGQIDYSNPFYMNKSTAFRAPYGAKGDNGLHISFCRFNSGSDKKDGYIYKMMNAIEEDYLHGEKKNLLYKTLRDKGCTFEEILYGVALPQKKGFLLGDNTQEEYEYNKHLKVSFESCVFKNLEDRIPKLRGGNVYMSNCLADSLEYYNYRKILQSKGAKISGNLKCALVSQGILVSNGGSFYMENSSFKGIDQFIKNNDSAPSGNDVKGGFKIVNSKYQKESSSSIIKGNSDENVFPVSGGNINKDNFSWIDDVKPFAPYLLNVDELEELLNNSTLKAGTSLDIIELLK